MTFMNFTIKSNDDHKTTSCLLNDQVNIYLYMVVLNDPSDLETERGDMKDESSYRYGPTGGLNKDARDIWSAALPVRPWKWF